MKQESQRFRRTGPGLGIVEVVNPFINSCSQQLYDSIQKEFGIHRIIQRPKWRHEFRLLLSELGGDKVRLQHVLDGYCTIPRNKYKPLAKGAKSFRRKFISIELWITRYAEEPDDLGGALEDLQAYLARCIVRGRGNGDKLEQHFDRIREQLMEVLGPGCGGRALPPRREH